MYMANCVHLEVDVAYFINANRNLQSIFYCRIRYTNQVMYINTLDIGDIFFVNLALNIVKDSFPAFFVFPIVSFIIIVSVTKNIPVGKPLLNIIKHIYYAGK